MVLTFPTHLFNPARIKMTPAGTVTDGGESLAGVQDVIRTDGGGYWVIDMTGIELNKPDLIRAWRAWEDTLDGGVAKVFVPVADVAYAPRPIIGSKLARPSALLATSEDPYFPEAVGFASPLIEAKLITAAALRATELTIEITRGARLKGGEVFGIEHVAGEDRRVYRVGRVLARDGINPQRATVAIRPPLRAAVAADIPLNFDWPSVTASLISNVDISPDIEISRHSAINISFREAFD